MSNESSRPKGRKKVRGVKWQDVGRGGAQQEGLGAIKSF